MRSQEQDCCPAADRPSLASQTTAYSYVIVSDAGFAPNPFGQFCTLANCKPKIRCRAETWRLGAWNGVAQECRQRQVGLCDAGQRGADVRPVGLDPRFASKKPQPDGTPEEQCGDNIYFRAQNGQWRQRMSFHHHPDVKKRRKIMKHDLGGKNVLISSHFFYFGKDAIKMPLRFKRLIHRGRAHSCHFPQDLVQRFLKWLHDRYEPGRRGEPSNPRRLQISSKPPRKDAVRQAKGAKQA